MGTDFQKDKKYNMNEFVKLKINLGKICYFPGEIINGTIQLIPTEKLKQPIISTPKVDYLLTQSQFYQYSTGSGKHRHTVRVNEDTTIFAASLIYNNIMEANILNGVNIPFSFQLSPNCLPTIQIHSRLYTRHLLTIGIAALEAKTTVVIVVKNPQYFSSFNGRLAAPAVKAENFTKKKFLFSKGNFTVTLKIPKNIFVYGEQIPFLVTLDCSSLELSLDGITIILERIANKNYKDNHSNRRSWDTSVINQKIYKFKQEKLPKYEISDVIPFPTSSTEISVFPPIVYNLLDQKQPEEIFKMLDTIVLVPASYTGLISVDYFIKVKVNFKSSLTTDESISLPIDVFSVPNAPPMANPPNVVPNPNVPLNPNMPPPNPNVVYPPPPNTNPMPNQQYPQSNSNDNYPPPEYLNSNSNPSPTPGTITSPPYPNNIPVSNEISNNNPNDPNMNYQQNNPNNYPNYSSPGTSFYGQPMSGNNIPSQPQANYPPQYQNSYPDQGSNNTTQQSNTYYNNIENSADSSELPPPLPSNADAQNNNYYGNNQNPDGQ